MGYKVIVWSPALMPVVVPSRGLEKKTTISKVCYLRCTKTVDNCKGKD